MAAFLARLFASGHAVDLVLAVMAVEGAWLVSLARRSAADVVLALLPGALLLVALRAALTGAGWAWVALFVTLSLPAHLADMRRRRL